MRHQETMMAALQRNQYVSHTETRMVTETCCNCGVLFGLGEQHEKFLRKTGNGFYCPNGHSQHYSETEEKRLREKLKMAELREGWARSAQKAAEDQAQAAEYRRRATKAAHTRTKNRIKHGVCPCCTRSFQDLRRHMEKMHPDYSTGEE